MKTAEDVLQETCDKHNVDAFWRGVEEGDAQMENIALEAMEAYAAQKMKEFLNWRPASEWWDFDASTGLWARFPVQEAPVVGGPDDEDWDEDYYTHFIPITNEWFPDELQNPEKT